MAKREKINPRDMTPRERNRYKKKRKRRKRRILLIIEIIVLILLLGVAYVVSKLGGIKFTSLGKIAKNSLDADTQQLLSGYTDIAFFGLDNRSNGDLDSGNSDSIMIASINNDTKEVRIVSVYRDTLLDTDGEGTLSKANSAYAKGGAKQAIEMLNRNLDLDIENYISVDFDALVEAVDAVGGIQVDVTQEEVDIMKEKGYIGEVGYVTGHEDEVQDITPGTNVTLNGVQATAWCRIRYTSSMDFGRANRQRIVVNKLIEKAKSASVSQLNTMIKTVFPHIATSLSMSQLIGMASAMQSYNVSGSTGFPFAMQTATLGKTGSVDVPCTLESNVKSLYSYLYDQSDYSPSSTVTEISEKIEKRSGLGEKDAMDYGYGTSQKEDSGDSVK